MPFAALLTCITFASSCQETPKAVYPTAPFSSRVLAARAFYVAPNGLPSGNGSRTSPWDLATALKQPYGVFPNDTIWLRGGTYEGDFVSRLKGQLGRPIVVRQYPGERAIIDGKLELNGAYAYYWGFEISYSDLRRVSSQPGSDPTDLPREGKTVLVLGPFLKLINLVIHDLGDGVFGSAVAEGLEVNGCIIFNNGWVGPDRGHGHNLYLQNAGAAKLIIDNVLFNSFGHALQIYGSKNAPLQNFRIEGNTMLGAGEPANILVANIVQYGGAPGRLGGFYYAYNSIFHIDGATDALGFGIPYPQSPGYDLTFSHNIVHGQSRFNEWSNYVVTDNRFTSGSSVLAGGEAIVDAALLPGQSPDQHTWNRNEYAVAMSPSYASLGLRPQGMMTFSQWQSVAGFDRDGSFTRGRFSGFDIVSRPSQYEAGRGLITVWNWDEQSSATLDLGSIVGVGQRFTVHHVYDMYGTPLVQGRYDGSPVALPLHAIAPPIPFGQTSARSTGLLLGVYLVQSFK